MPHNNAALPGTEYKAMQGQVNIDEAEGIIECFVAGLGNKDSVGDICLPGCFTESLKRRKPRVVWGHNWNEPIGKVIEIYEVGPNDPRLPMKMKRAGIGGLYAKVQFNLKSERGRQAFADVASSVKNKNGQSATRHLMLIMTHSVKQTSFVKLNCMKFHQFSTVQTN